MSEQNDEKLRNGEKILEHIKNIRSDYEAKQVDEQEEELDFLDHLNKLVQLIVGDSTFSVYTALEKNSLERWKNNKFKRWLKKLIVSNFQNTLYFLLLATITGFLVSEALSFYAIGGALSTKTYVKAILTEVCFIFLSGYRSSGKIEFIGVGALRVSIFTLMMFVITSQAFDTGVKTISENAAIAQQIQLLEEQIEQKDKEIEYFKSIKYKKNATRTTIEKQKLIEKLVKLKEEQAAGKNEDVSKVEEIKMYGRAAFRVILLFISVLITRRIFSF